MHTAVPNNIRPAQLNDASAISALLAELGFSTPPETVTDRLDQLHALGEQVLVYTIDNRPVGLITIHITPVLHRPTSVGRITALVVSSQHRRCGVGRALLTAAEHYVIQKGCALLELTSNTKWVQAHAFYESQGFQRTSIRFFKDLITLQQ